MGRFKGVLGGWPQTSVKKQPIFTNFTNSYRDRRRSPPQPTGARRSSAEKKLPDNSESLVFISPLPVWSWWSKGLTCDHLLRLVCSEALILLPPRLSLTLSSNTRCWGYTTGYFALLPSRRALCSLTRFGSFSMLGAACLNTAASPRRGFFALTCCSSPPQNSVSTTVIIVTHRSMYCFTHR